MGRAATAAAARPQAATEGRARRAPAAAGTRPGRIRTRARRGSGRHRPRVPAVARLAHAGALPIRVLNAPFARALRARTSSVLDALLSGRGWIALIGVLLAGIVFFNVDLLQMNRDIARDAEKASALGRENARLRLTLARLGSSERIQEAAAGLGLVLPAPGEVRYLKAHPVDARRAAKRITEPNEALVPPAPEPTAPSAAPAATTSIPPTTTTTPPTGAAPAPTTTTPPAAAATTPPAGTTPTVPQTTTPPAATGVAAPTTTGQPVG
jgi:cell division protein FtsL